MNSLLLRRRQRGFSVVELMVSVVVGLLALMFATKLIVNAEQNKAVSLGGSDAMQNGMLALFSMSGDAGQAGWGVNDVRINGCNTLLTDTQHYALLPVQAAGALSTPLAPVVIQSNGQDSDQISFNFSGSTDASGSIALTGPYKLGDTTLTTAAKPNEYMLAAPAAGNLNNVLLVAHDPPIAGGKCAITEYASISNTSLITIGGGRFGPAGGLGEAFGTVNVPGTTVFNLGPENLLALHTWSVQSGVLLLRASNLAGAAANAVSVVDNVVAIKAQYGFDTRVMPVGTSYTPDNGMVVSQWSGPMIDADGDAVTGGPGDFQRIAAVRLAIVARSKNPEKPSAASGQCSATTALPTVFGTNVPNGTPGVAMTVNVAVATDPVDWKCYRYRVFETIVPLRNVQWRP